MLFIAVLYFKNFKSMINRAFIVFSLAVLGWSFFYFLWQLSSDYELALFFTKLLMVFAALIPASFLFAVLAYVGQLRQKLSRLVTAYLISLPLSFLALSDQIVSSLAKNKYHSLWPLAGPMLDVFLVVWFSILVYSNLLLYEAYRKETDRGKKGQLLILIVGFSLSFLGGATNFFLWYNVQFPPMGNFVGPVFVIFVAYAVMKLGFLDYDSTKEQISTFWNDLLFNPFKGFSITTDKDTGDSLRNFHSFPELEKSNLLNLTLVKKKSKSLHSVPVDALRKVLEEAIEYFKPENNPSKRIKSNLKYNILRMTAFDQAEEGQILWELGFEEYPVKIMSQARSYREPLFKIQSPSDYTYTSRNAYLALKKEAIHDITWRISYLEKQAKKRIF